MKTNEKRVPLDNDVIDLREVYFALKKRILLILAAGLIGSCLYGAYTVFFMEPCIPRPPVFLCCQRKQH